MDVSAVKKKDVDMKNLFSTAGKTLAVALAASTFSFAGPGLADGAAKFVGNITQSGTAPGPNDQFTKLWNQATAENGCKWGSVEGQRGKYNWGACDAAYNWAKQNGGHFKFHALVWGSQYPSWLNGLSTDETKKAITAWFDAVKQHYPDLEMIDVVNEAIRTGNNSYHSPYGKNNNIIPALGGDDGGNYQFVVTAFKMARERWPDAILIYNDYNTIQWNVDQGIDLIKKIKAAGAPVDGYGLQAHDLMTNGGNGGGTGGGGYCMDYTTFKNTMEKIHSQTNNIPIFISEYDVPSTDDGIQKQCVSEQFAYWMEDPHVAGITFWGYIYGQTWLDCNGKANGCSGLIRNGQDRTAMTWLKEYLSKNKGVNTTGLPTGDVTPVEPEPQTPFKGQPFDLSAKIEAEDFDIPGKGAGNNSYSVSGSCDDTWNTEYRKGTSVSIGEKNGGLVLGCNPTGNYFQYTINVAEAGTYVLNATVAADGEGALVFKVGDKVVSDTLKYTGSSWSTFEQVTGSITLDKGEQILTMEVAKGYIDIDHFTIQKEGTIAIEDVHYERHNGLQHYLVSDPMGVRMGVISAYGFDAAAEMVKTSSVAKNSGVYYLKNSKTGEMHSVRVVR